MRDHEALLKDWIDSIARNFDKKMYLRRGKRTIPSLTAILKLQAAKYKAEIKAAQQASSAVAKKWLTIANREYVACVIAAKSINAYSFGTSYSLPKKLDNELRQRLQTLGKLGERSQQTGSKNIIGKCAEAKAANRILLHSNKERLDSIEFTKALRPRTSEEVIRCPNCIRVFGKES